MKFHKLFYDWPDLQEFTAGNTVYSAGEPADTLYFIRAGKVELSLHGVSLGIEKRGNIIGEMAMMKSARQSVTASVVSDVKLARIDRKQLKRLIKNNNAFSIHVMSALAKRLSDVDRFITNQIATIPD